MAKYLHSLNIESAIRPWPYPFQAGLSISNDAEFMSLDFFETLMAFLNTKSPTDLGTGLGLEITSSLFHFSANPYNFSYFNGSHPQSPLESYASRLDEYLKAGWLDTLHAYGDFDGFGGFERAHAERVLEQLDHIGVTINVFTNHGGVENIQNIGTDVEYHRGDHLNHPAYHTDLLKKHGVQFVWTDTMVTVKRQRSPKLFYSQIKDIVRTFLPIPQKTYFPQSSPHLMKPVDMQDSTRFIGFRRFRSTGINAPNLSSLGYQLQQINWPRFYKQQEALVIYQHLGVLYRQSGKCIAATIAAMKERPQIYVSPLRFLAQEFHAGRLWVVGTARFLQYMRMLETTCLKQHSNCIYLHCPIVNSDPQHFFQGLTVYHDPSIPIKIVFGTTELNIVHNGPDQSGRYSVSVPLQPMANIW